MSFSKLVSQISDDFCMSWEESLITEKQKKVWSVEGCRKFLVVLEYNARKLDHTHYSLEYPSVENVLASFAVDSSVVYDRTFPEFCHDFGFDVDSIKALNKFKQCKKQKKKLMTFLGDDLFHKFMTCSLDF